MVPMSKSYCSGQPGPLLFDSSNCREQHEFEQKRVTSEWRCRGTSRTLPCSTLRSACRDNCGKRSRHFPRFCRFSLEPIRNLGRKRFCHREAKDRDNSRQKRKASLARLLHYSVSSTPIRSSRLAVFLLLDLVARRFRVPKGNDQQRAEPPS